MIAENPDRTIAYLAPVQDSLPPVRNQEPVVVSLPMSRRNTSYRTEVPNTENPMEIMYERQTNFAKMLTLIDIGSSVVALWHGHLIGLLYTLCAVCGLVGVVNNNVYLMTVFVASQHIMIFLAAFELVLLYDQFNVIVFNTLTIVYRVHVVLYFIYYTKLAR